MSIEVKNLSYVYHPKTPLEVTALLDVSFEIKKGDWVSLVGHTGSGKSTLACHLNGLAPPASGSVVVDGIDVSSKEVRQVRRKVGLVFQYPEQQLFAQTVREEVAFGPVNWGFSQEDTAEGVRSSLSALGFADEIDEIMDKNPLHLSGGQKRRVAIASVITSRPDYLVLDEPTAGLDSEGVADLMKLLESLCKSGVAVLHITHDLELALNELGVPNQRIFILEKGRLTAFKDIDETIDFLKEAQKNGSMTGLAMPPILDIALQLEEQNILKNAPRTVDPRRLAQFITDNKNNKNNSKDIEL